MVRAARNLHRALQGIVRPTDEAILDEPPGGRIAPSLDYSSLRVKLQKRLWFPLHLRWKRFDVLHLICGDYLVWLSSATMARTVATFHDMMPFLLSERLEDVFPKRIGRWFYRQTIKNMKRCGAIAADSAFSKECILRFTDCPEEKVSVIPLGVDTCFHPLPADAPALCDFAERHGLADRKVVLHVGTAEPYKNLETVFEVMRRLLDTVDASLLFLKIGGSFSSQQQGLIRKLSLSDHIVHLVGLSEEELVFAYNLSTLLLWPSYFEGFGLPVLEAMACGTPVVCSNGGSLPEVAGTAAAVHEALDTDGLVLSCMRVLTDDAFREHLRRAGVEQAARFTWEHTAQQYYQLYGCLYEKLRGGDCAVSREWDVSR